MRSDSKRFELVRFDPVALKLARHAGAREYANWLRGFLEKGGKITHKYDYPFSSKDFFVALESFAIPNGVCGTLSFDVIALLGIKVTHKGHDHCNVYPLDYKDTSDLVPLYSDIAKRLEGCSLREEAPVEFVDLLFSRCRGTGGSIWYHSFFECPRCGVRNEFPSMSERAREHPTKYQN